MDDIRSDNAKNNGAGPDTTPFDALTAEELRHAYAVGCRSRALDEWIVRLVNQGKVKFAIWGPGEEIHGTATAMAWKKVMGGPDAFGFCGHYRSGSMVSMWCELNGKTDFTLDILRQQLSKDTDPMSRGRQMVYHFLIPELGILPVQSPVGMQLGKAAGYAKGFMNAGKTGAVVFASIGDGSTAEGDMHDAMNAAAVWDLPLVIMVTDNEIAISTTPGEGRGIKSYEKYAEAFGFSFLSCDGGDFQACYNTAYEATQIASTKSRPVLWHVHSLPRLNGHSSAGNYRYALEERDPLMEFGKQLVDDGILDTNDIYQRITGEGADFFNHHELGSIMGEAYSEVETLLRQVEGEPEPPAESIYEHIRPPIPAHPDPADLTTRPTTNITYAGALRAAHRWILENRNGMVWGEDVAKLGGVMQATAGLKEGWPDKVIDSPLNEPLVVGTGMGAALHPNTTVVAEIQFGDYSLNTYHWLVYLGNLYWQTYGVSKSSVIVRMPTDPFGGGAIYHSMSVDGYFAPIPGLVICMPSTSYDAYGLLVSAAEYGAPVVFLEPKWCYRRNLGPQIPGEPTDAEAVKKMKGEVLRGAIPDFDHVQVELGKAATWRTGTDLTVIAWGRTVHRALAVAESLAGDGVSVEVIDLRTIVPPDMDTIFASVRKTGRLLVASEDRVFSGFGREIQGAVASRWPGIPSDVVGMKPVPGIAQNHHLEDATALSEDDIRDAARRLLETTVQGSGQTQVAWLPAPYLIG